MAEKQPITVRQLLRLLRFTPDDSEAINTDLLLAFGIGLDTELEPKYDK